MTEGEFQAQMNRLIQNYGAEHYKSERVKVIWQEVKDLPGPWFAKVVGNLIGESRYAPLLPDFREAASIERERMHERKRREEAADAKAFWEGTYQPEEAKHISQQILKRVAGQLSDQDFEALMKQLKTAADRGGK